MKNTWWYKCYIDIRADYTIETPCFNTFKKLMIYLRKNHLVPGYYYFVYMSKCKSKKGDKLEYMLMTIYNYNTLIGHHNGAS